MSSNRWRSAGMGNPGALRSPLIGSPSPFMGAMRQAARDAEHRSPVRIGIGTPPEGLGSRLDHTFPRLDASGADGWTSTPRSAPPSSGCLLATGSAPLKKSSARGAYANPTCRSQSLFPRRIRGCRHKHPLGRFGENFTIGLAVFAHLDPVWVGLELLPVLVGRFPALMRDDID